MHGRVSLRHTPNDWAVHSSPLRSYSRIQGITTEGKSLLGTEQTLPKYLATMRDLALPGIVRHRLVDGMYKLNSLTFQNGDLP